MLIPIILKPSEVKAVELKISSLVLRAIIELPKISVASTFSIPPVAELLVTVTFNKDVLLLMLHKPPPSVIAGGFFLLV